MLLLLVCMVVVTCAQEGDTVHTHRGKQHKRQRNVCKYITGMMDHPVSNEGVCQYSRPHTWGGYAAYKRTAVREAA